MLVVGTEYQFNDIVGIEFLFLERQVCNQSHLVSNGRVVAELLDERFRQCLLEDGELINVSFKAVSAEVHCSGDTSQFDGSKGGSHFAVKEY